MSSRLKTITPAVVGAVVMWLSVVASVSVSAQRRTTPRPAPASVQPAARPAAEDLNAAVRRYCVTCHNDRAKTGGLSLTAFDVARAADNTDVAERMIRKLQAGLMPPPSAARPDAAMHTALVSALESNVDAAAATKPNPGVRTFQRLNRPEYARAIRDLLELDLDAGSWLPLDTKSANFDNIADAQALSPTLLEAYLNAAATISRMAVGDRSAPTVDSTYTNAGYVSQHPWDRVEGAPFGTRGGMVVNHVFPADAEYVFEVSMVSGSNARFEDIDISINGERVALIEYEPGPAVSADGRRGRIRTEARWTLRGPDSSARLVVRRRWGRRSGYHHAAACPRSDDQGALQDHGRFGNAQPSEDLQLPSHPAGGGAAVRTADRDAARW